MRLVPSLGFLGWQEETPEEIQIYVFCSKSRQKPSNVTAFKRFITILNRSTQIIELEFPKNCRKLMKDDAAALKFDIFYTSLSNM